MLTIGECEDLLFSNDLLDKCSPRLGPEERQRVPDRLMAFRWLVGRKNAMVEANTVTASTRATWLQHVADRVGMSVWENLIIHETVKRAEGVGHGGSGGLGVTCACGGLATRFGGDRLSPMCRACDMRRLVAEQPKPVPPPAPAHCACGAELMGVKALTLRECGDCTGAYCGHKPQATLAQRILLAQPPKPDPDPSSDWTAGATPSAEWP